MIRHLLDASRFGVLTTVNEDDDEEEETPEQQASKAEQSPSREEVDAAIKLVRP